MTTTPPELPAFAESIAGTRDWPHAPPHRLAAAGVYLVTSRTRGRIPHLASTARREAFQALLLASAHEAGWRLEAWAILSNHFHFIAHSPDGAPSAASLRILVRKLHGLSTMRWNQEDGTPGRARLWHNFRETHLTLQRGYLARLNYVHQNAVHHRLVRHAAEYPWCSAVAFREAVTPAWERTIEGFEFSRIADADEDEPDDC
ncbi:MAG: transposase [Verrucomicrobia bacterium]|nr:transposase [Verrucomicrobiota bacterium]